MCASSNIDSQNTTTTYYEAYPKSAPYNFLTTQHTLKHFTDTTAKVLGSLTPILVFVIHACVGYDCFIQGVGFFL